MDGTSLFIGLMTGSIGFGYLMYGRKKKAVVPLVAGLLMCVMPYIVSDNLFVVLVSLVLMVIPFVFRF